jgi:hypothetical protein
MVVGKIRKFFLKLGLGYLPWLAIGAAGIYSGQKFSDQYKAIHYDVNTPASYYSDKRNYEIGRDLSKNFLPFVAAVSGLFLLTSFGNYLSRKRRIQIEAHKGIEKILDYPGIASTGITAAVVGAAAGAAALNEGSFPNYLANKDPAVFGAYAACAGAFVQSSLQLLFSAFSVYKSPSAKNFFRSFNNFFKNVPTTSESIKNVIAVESEISLSSRAKACINEGNKLDALYYWNASLQFKKRTSALEDAIASNSYDVLGEKIGMQILLYKNSKELKKCPGSLPLLVQRQFLHMRGFQYDKIRQISEKILSNPCCSEEERVLQSFIYDAIGDSCSADRIRHEVLPLLLANQQYRIGKGIVFSKPGSKERLAGESSLLSKLQHSCEKYDFEAARPLGIWESMGRSWLFEVFSDGTNLHDYLDRNPDTAVLRKAALAQAALHTLVPSERKFFISDDIASFLGRVPDTWFLDKQVLYDSLSELIAPLGEYLSADCDGHRQNRNYNTSKQITVYDLEPRGDAPMSFDYAKLLRQGRWVGSWGAQKQILAECADFFNKNKRPSWVNPEILANHVLKASPYKALRYAVFALDKPEKHNTALNFLGNSETDIHMIEEKALASAGCCRALSDAVETAEREIITASASKLPRTFL